MDAIHPPPAIIEDDNDIDNEEAENIIIPLPDDDDDDDSNVVHVVADNEGNGLAAALHVYDAIGNNPNLNQADNEEEADRPPRRVENDAHEPSRMHLTVEERLWALSIKQAIEEEPELDNLSDFWYAQLAVVTLQSRSLTGLQDVVERAQILQAFRQEYKVIDTLGHAQRTLHEVMKLFPRYFLCFYHDDQEGHFTYVVDSTKLSFKSHSSNDRALISFYCCMYYLLQAANPDFEATRAGISTMAECEGFNMTENFGNKFFVKIWTELLIAYPLQLISIKHFHTSMFKNLLLSMAKQFIPKEMHDKFETGCVCELGRLDRMYLIPNVEQANERFGKTFRECLQRRYVNEKTFSLQDDAA